MSLFSRLFGGQAAIERQLRDWYAQMLSAVPGYTARQAEQQASEMIALCKQQGKAEGTTDLPADFGDRILQAARFGEAKSRRIVERARREGATDDDIREWWNLGDLARRMVLLSEDTFRISVFMHASEDDGLSPEDAAARVHKMFPIYGDPEDTSTLTGDNRPLPHELRGRIDAYRITKGAEHVKEQVKYFQSYNAFVRHAIRNGLI